MKNGLLTIFIAFTFVRCSEKETVAEPVAELGSEAQFEALIDIDREIGENPAAYSKFAPIMFAAANDFVNKFQNNERTADALELAAKGAEEMGRCKKDNKDVNGANKYFDIAINILHQLSTEFEESEKTPSYMFNIGRVLEVQGKKNNAKAAYNAVIERFPDSFHAELASAYLNAEIFNMSKDELVEFLKNQNPE